MNREPLFKEKISKNKTFLFRFFPLLLPQGRSPPHNSIVKNTQFPKCYAMEIP